MDVSLSWTRGFLASFLILSLSACGDRYDLSTARGQQSRIDDANMFLSKGECAEADAAINPLYAVPPVSEQVRIVKASAQACFAGYSLLRFAGGIIGSANFYQSLAKSMDNVSGDAARQWMYNAVDVLAQNGTALAASSRTTAENSYMFFLQLGVITAIIRNYGSPDPSSGAQGANLIYSSTSNPAGEMTDKDACALAAAYSFLSDSFANSDLTDSSTASLVSSMNSVCASAGIGSCTSLNRDRTQCDGANANSVKAEAIVNGVNSAW